MSPRLAFSLKVLASTAATLMFFAGVVALTPPPQFKMPETDLKLEIPAESSAPATEPEPVVSTNSTLVPTAYLLVSAKGTVTEEDGTLASIQIDGVSPTCDGKATSLSSVSRTWADGPVSSRVLSAKWCVAMRPGTSPGFKELNGVWRRADNVELDSDFAISYLSVTSPTGLSQALKLTALAYCDEDKGCGSVVQLELGDDDAQVTTILQTGAGEYSRISLSDDGASIQEAVVPKERPATSVYRRPQLHVDYPAALVARPVVSQVPARQS